MKYSITFHPKWWHKNAGIDFSKAFFDEPEYRMDCDVKMRRELYERFGKYGIGERNPEKRPLIGSDLLAAGYVHSQIMGCEIVYAADNSPQVICKNLSENDISDIKAPVLSQHSVFKAIASQTDYLKGKFGYVLPFINLMGVQNIALDLMGENLFMAYYSAENEVRSLLFEITKLCIDFGREMRALSSDISGGVTEIVRAVMPNCYLTSNCSVEMISQAIYESFLLSHDKALADEFKSFGIHHCGQTMEHVVDGYAKLGERLTFAEAGAGSDISAVRRSLTNVPINARYSPASLLRDSAAQMETTIQALVNAANGKLVSVSCVGIDDSASEESIINFLAACEQIKCD